MLFCCLLTHLCENVDLAAKRSLMDFDDAVHNRDVPSLDIENNDFACSQGRLAHVEKEDVSPVESWLHAATQHNHYLRIRSKRFPVLT